MPKAVGSIAVRCSYSCQVDIEAGLGAVPMDSSPALPLGHRCGYPFFLRLMPRTPCLLVIHAAGEWFSTGFRLTPGSSDQTPQRKFCGLFTGDHSGDPLLLRLSHGKPLCDSKTLCRFLGSSGGLFEVALASRTTVTGVSLLAWWNVVSERRD